MSKRCQRNVVPFRSTKYDFDMWAFFMLKNAIPCTNIIKIADYLGNLRKMRLIK